MNIKTKYYILNSDYYNFDKTNFIIEIIYIIIIIIINIKKYNKSELI